MSGRDGERESGMDCGRESRRDVELENGCWLSQGTHQQ